ncbi:MAG: DUF4394 domain-containing protein [Solirubrobacterales bacterium]
MSIGRRFKLLLASVALALVPAGIMASQSQAGETAAALAGDNTIVTFPVSNPGTVTEQSPVFPLSASDTDLVGLDYRPRGGGLYAVASGGTFYVLTPGTVANTFQATPINSTPGAAPFTGPEIGFDFNPAPDAIRLVTAGGGDFRFSPNNGSLLGTDGALAYATGDVNAGDPSSVVGSGYTNSRDGTGGTGTTLYGIEADNDTLVTQGSVNATPTSPNTGQLFTVGSLGVDTTPNAGLDIAPGSGTAYAALEAAGSPGTSSLYTVSPDSGAASLVGPIGGGDEIEGIAIVPASTFNFANQVTSIDERAGTATIVVTRSGPLNRAATVDYTSTGGGATDGSGTLTFPVGESRQTFDVAFADQPAEGPDRTVDLTLTNASANAILGERATSSVLIVNQLRPVTPVDPDPPADPGPVIGLVGVKTSRLGEVINAGKVRVAYSCSRDCTTSMTLKAAGRKIGSATASLTKAGKANVTIKVKPNQRKFVKRKAGRKGAIKLRLGARFVADDQPTSSLAVKFRVTR